MANEKSPAVNMLKEKQALQGSFRPLDEGLEDKPLASDPASATTTTIPSGTGLGAKSDAPRVDQALESILEHRDDPYVEPREHLAALREEAESLQYRATDNMRNSIRRNPWQAVGLAVAVGFIVGVTR